MCPPRAFAMQHATHGLHRRARQQRAPPSPTGGRARSPVPGARSGCALGRPVAPRSAPIRRTQGPRRGTAPRKAAHT
eukprot:3888858-Alexandrium_andersonii.AAC.1